MKKIKIKLSQKNKRVLLISALVIIFAGLIYFILFFKNRNVVAVVNGYPVTIKDILVEMESSPSVYKETLEVDPKSVVETYINQILLYQEAKRYERRLKRDVDDMMKNYYIKVMAKAYVDKILTERIKVADEEITEYYNTHLEEFLIPEKVRLFEIVLPTQEKAEVVRKRLSLGESFELIAMNESISASKEKAGDLGWIDVRKLEPEIAALVSRMTPGDILANIIRTEAGYHIIKLAGKTESRMLTLEEAKPSIKEMLVSFKKKGEVDILMAKLKEKGRIRIYLEKVERLKSK
ncbi:MAG: peptidyl-prolyl cis-trans isomerase [Candidatus Omnitrophica bacterium]|nr:peptidyl-prolyl cis-trans isomerase [Candidatus Omnitrophota bacterium]